MINALDIKATAYLHARGITAETIARYRIDSTTHNGRAALRYPTFGEKGAVGWRIKYIDGGESKYEWVGKNGVNYYSPGMLLDAIEANNGTLYILNGEPAIWAHHAYQIARGANPELAAPSIAWFGENSVPLTLAADLERLGAKHVFVFPDCDEVGYKSALKVHDLLSPTLRVSLVDLPFEYGSKNDFNDLWIASQFDVAKMPTMKQLTKETIYERAPKLLPKVMPIQEAFRPVTNGNGNHSSDVDFKAMQREWIDSIITALGSPAKMEGRVPRWHCPLPTHADNHPSFTVDMDKLRPRCTCGIQDRETAWDEVAHAKGLPAWLEYRKEQLTKQAPQKTEKAQQGKEPPPQAKRTFSKGSDVLKSLDTLVYHGDTSHIGNPVVFPFKSMHFLGGLCRHIPAGMLVGVGGGSGEGKTTLIETFLDYWNRGGIDVPFYSPEWTRELVMQRRIQRYSGYNGNVHVDVDAFTALTLWLKERDLGIASGNREGSDFIALRDEYERIKKYLLNWQGEVLIACDDDPTAPMYLETFLEMTADTIADARKQKRRADATIVDYAQLAEVMNASKNENVVTQVIRKIKKHATLHKYVGIVASQITKASSKEQKRGNAPVTSDDMQFLRSDQFNLCMTINRVFEEKEGVMMPTDFVDLYVDKNSLGRAKQKLRYRTDYPHLRWVDEVVQGLDA